MRKVKELCDECGEYSYILKSDRGEMIKYVKACKCVQEVLDKQKKVYVKYDTKKSRQSIINSL